MKGPRTHLSLYPGYGRLDWTVGGLFAHDDIIMTLADAVNAHFPDEGRPFQAVFGGVGECAWHGGRVAPTRILHLENVPSLFEEYNARGIAVRFTFSYWDISGKDLDDSLGNTLLEMAADSGGRHDIRNGVIVCSDILSDYIRNKYPSLEQTCSSIWAVRTFPEWNDTPQWYNDMAKRFEKVVLRPSYNFDDEFLARLEPKNKMEILVNNICRMWCPNEMYHMDLQKKAEILTGEERERVLALTAEHEAACFHYGFANPTDTVNCSARDMRRIKDLGFSQFKLAGRECPPHRFLWFLSMYLFESGGSIQNIMPGFSLHYDNIRRKMS